MVNFLGFSTPSPFCNPETAGSLRENTSFYLMLTVWMPQWAGSIMTVTREELTQKNIDCPEDEYRIQRFAKIRNLLKNGEITPDDLRAEFFHDLMTAAHNLGDEKLLSAIEQKRNASPHWPSLDEWAKLQEDPDTSIETPARIIKELNEINQDFHEALVRNEVSKLQNEADIVKLGLNFIFYDGVMSIRRLGMELQNYFDQENQHKKDIELTSACVADVGHEPTIPAAPQKIPGQKFRIDVIGDSLAAMSNYPENLSIHLKNNGWDIAIKNRGISGRESDYGPEAAQKILSNSNKPDLVILELGGNDLLARKSPDEIKDNLEQTIILLQQKEIPILLVGMNAPVAIQGARSFSNEYRESFDKIFPDLAHDYGLNYVPVAYGDVVNKSSAPLVVTDTSLSNLFHKQCMSDSIHPNYGGAEFMAANMMDEVQKALLKISGREVTPPDTAPTIPVFGQTQKPGI